VTAVSHASSLSKRKVKEKEKENQYKIRKTQEKKNKIVSVQASYNNVSAFSYCLNICNNLNYTCEYLFFVASSSQVVVATTRH